MFNLLFKNDLMRVSFDKYYMPLVEIKNFTALIDNKPFLINLWKTNKNYINLDLVIPMYNMTEYCSNYSETA